MPASSLCREAAHDVPIAQRVDSQVQNEILSFLVKTGKGILVAQVCSARQLYTSLILRLSNLFSP